MVERRELDELAEEVSDAIQTDTFERSLKALI
jgi:hypothetical protein